MTLSAILENSLVQTAVTAILGFALAVAGIALMPAPGSPVLFFFGVGLLMLALVFSLFG